MMQVYMITFSPTGGTDKVARALSVGLCCRPQELSLLRPLTESNTPVFGSGDLCVVAMPVYGGRIPTAAAERLRTLRGNGAKAAAVAVYGNREIDDALVEMEDILTDCGFTLIAGAEAVAEHSIVRKYGEGRPDVKDELELEAMGRAIADKFVRGDLHRPKLPGNRPYKVFGGGLKPLVDQRCGLCGICAGLCPVGAIPFHAPNTTDTSKCISCMRCLSVCPSRSRYLDPKALAGLSEHLAPVCAGRKKNKLYI